MKTFLVYGSGEAVRIITAENARVAKSLYLARTFSGTPRGSKRTATVVRDTARNRRKLGLAEQQDQKPSAGNLAKLRARFDQKRTK